MTEPARFMVAILPIAGFIGDYRVLGEESADGKHLVLGSGNKHHPAIPEQECEFGVPVEYRP